MSEKRILIVDDEPLVRQYLIEFLDVNGFEAMGVEDAVAGLEILRQKADEFGLLIVDYTMPKMNGLKLARQVIETYPGLPVVLCSGYTTEVNSDTAKAAGLVAFLNKPIDSSRLLRVVRESLSKSGDI